MKGKVKYILVLILFIGILVAVQVFTPKPLDWTKTYSNDDKIPYGTYLTYDILKQQNSDVKTIKKPLLEYVKNNVIDTNKNYNFLFIENDINLDTFEISFLMKMAHKGSTVLIANNSLNSIFADTFHIEYNWSNSNFETGDTNIRTQFISDKNDSSKFYNFEIDRYYHTIKSYRDSNVLAISRQVIDNRPEMVKVNFGKGQFIFNSLPDAFSNYEVVRNNNYEYVAKTFSYLPNYPILWDEYYKVNRYNDSGNSMKLLLENPPLQWAYYILIYGILLFFIFNAKRRQRAIPVVVPLENSSIEYSKTIGTLYFQKGSNKEIAMKKIQYFYMYLRQKYQIHYTAEDDRILPVLKSRTGFNESDMKYIVFMLKKIPTKTNVSNYDLEELYKAIEKFKNNYK